MTPEKRADKIIRDHTKLPQWVAGISDAIRMAIEEAVVAERESCAVLLDKIGAGLEANAEGESLTAFQQLSGVASGFRQAAEVIRKGSSNSGS